MPHVSNNVSLGGGGSGGEDATSDEVKIFTEEGTEETEKRDSERGLDEEKTSLVNISDSDKVVPSSNFFLPQGSIFGANPFHLAARYKGENGKLLDPATLYGNGEAFRYFIPPYPHHNGYPMGFRPSTNSLAQLMLYNQEHFAQPPPAHMGIPTMSIDPKSGMPRLSPYAFPSPHQYSHPGAVYATDFRQGSWPSPGLYPISTSTFPPMPYSPGPGFPPNFAKYSPPILSPVTPASPYGPGMSPAFGATNSIKGDYMYPDLKSSPHFPIDPHHPLHAAAAFGLAAAHHSPHQQLLHHHPASYGHHPGAPGQGPNAHVGPPNSSHPHAHPFFMGPPHPLHASNGYAGGSQIGNEHAKNTNAASKGLQQSHHHHHTTNPEKGGSNSSTNKGSSNASHNTTCAPPSSTSTSNNGPHPNNVGGTKHQLALNNLAGPASSGKKKKSSHNNPNSTSGPGGTQNVVPHIKKPLNAFMLFMKDQRSKVMEECTLKESSAINQLLGRKWHGLTREEQAKYYEMARKERQIHMQLYPGWTARDNYTSHNCIKKRKKKREKAIDPIDINDLSASKKCRARYGIEQQNNWCKPCRRKKKCIKFIDDSDSNNNDDIDCGDDNSQHSNSISPTMATFISTAAYTTNPESAPSPIFIPNGLATTTLEPTSNPTTLHHLTSSHLSTTPPSTSDSGKPCHSGTHQSEAHNLIPIDEGIIGSMSKPQPKSNFKDPKNVPKSQAITSKEDTKSDKQSCSHRSKGSHDCDCCHNGHHHVGFRGKPCKNIGMMPPLPLNPYYFAHPHPYFFPPPPPALHTMRRHKNSSPYFTFTNEREEELLMEDGNNKAECCHHAVEDYDGGSPLSPLSVSPPPPNSPHLPASPPPENCEANQLLSSTKEASDEENRASPSLQMTQSVVDQKLATMPQLKVHPGIRHTSNSNNNNPHGGKTIRSSKLFSNPHHFMSLASPEAAAAVGYNFYNHGLQYNPFVPGPHHGHHPSAEKLLKTQLKKQHREQKRREVKDNARDPRNSSIEECANCSRSESYTEDAEGKSTEPRQRNKKCRCRPKSIFSDVATHHPYMDFYHHHSKGVTPAIPSPFPPPDYYFYNYMFNNHHHHRGKGYGLNPSHPLTVNTFDKENSIYAFEEESEEEGELMTTKPDKPQNKSHNNHGSNKRSVHRSLQNETSNAISLPRPKKARNETTIPSASSVSVQPTPVQDGISSPRITSNTLGSGSVSEEGLAVPSPLQPPDSSSDLPLHKILIQRQQTCSCKSLVGENEPNNQQPQGKEQNTCARCKGKNVSTAMIPPTSLTNDTVSAGSDNNGEMTHLQDDDNLHYYHYEGGDTDQLVIRPEDGPEQDETNGCNKSHVSVDDGKSASIPNPPTNLPKTRDNKDTTNNIGENVSTTKSLDVNGFGPSKSVVNQTTFHGQRMEYGSCSYGEKPMLVTSSPLKQKTT